MGSAAHEQPQHHDNHDDTQRAHSDPNTAAIRMAVSMPARRAREPQQGGTGGVLLALSGQVVEQIRISQINGCAFWLRVHTRDALGRGHTAERLGRAPGVAGDHLLLAADRAALPLSEAITLIGDGHVAEETYPAATVHLSAEQSTAVSWLTIVMNALDPRQRLPRRHRHRSG